MADFPERYAVCFADLNPTIGSEIHQVRPVVIVSRNEMNRLVSTVVVCPLTSALHPRWRGRLQIQCAGMDAEIAVDQIRAIDKQRLRRRIDRLSADDARLLRRTITERYGQ